ncbi:hypothetical protein G7085_06340 [Tessaracoccus sp. HDW20]|uniref:hypothetical protein n=1 Tax=Tessaracoccus coleopterorum TaxID=2714950 RepID=UPI0018D41B8B|nr:hypothetical protein [Tessaracoccus coleopterorum]NHB84350.1 hypothetical protein [Tessaracoccus coleopterorum]
MEARVGDELTADGEAVTVVGRTDDPRTLWAVTGYTGAPSVSGEWATDVAVRLARAQTSSGSPRS